MSTFNGEKSSPNKNEIQNASLAMKSRQQVINEVNKRRTLLQDNSWIKKRPEEEKTDENYGRAVLNQYKSQDGLHRNTDENGDQKALLSRYRSDTTLDRIPGRSDADKGNKSSSVDNMASKSKELDASSNTADAASPVKKKRQSWMPPPVSSSKVAIQDEEHQKSNELDASSNTADAASPVKKKRQSWMPPPVSSSKDAIQDEEQQKRHSWGQPNTVATVAVNNKPVSTVSDKPGGPKMIVYSSEPTAPSKPNAAVNGRPAIRPKPSELNAKKPGTERVGRSIDQDNHFEGKPSINNSNKHEQGHRDLDDIIKDNRTSNGHDKEGTDRGNLNAVNKTAQKNKRGQEPDELKVITPPTKQNKKHFSLHRETERGYESGKIQDNQLDADHLYQVKRGPSQFPYDAYEDNISGKSIKTVYSTSDRTIIEKEMCTYCRKPLGTDTKMILDALQIFCHATCFKCEVCHGPLEDLKAGDSIWIYRNTVHCTPCYAEVKASWVY